MEKQTGKKPKDLEEPCDFPIPLAHIWSAFSSLHSARQYGMGANPITYTEIKSWMVVTENYLTPVEVDILKKLDVIFLEVSNG